MKQQHILSPATASALTALGLLLAACSGGGGGGSSGSASSFSVDSVSVLAGSTWQINREIVVRFSSDVDFSSVNLNTIQVGQVGGAPAAGEFRQATLGDGVTPDLRRIIFAPRCPTLADYSDAGLVPGGIAYRLNIVGGSGFTVKSMNGQNLPLGLTVNFTTPNSPDASVLFVDTVPGPPAAVIRSSTDNLNASYLEIGGSSVVADRQYFRYPATIDADLGAQIENPAFEAPLNLYSDLSSQVSAVIVVNQAIDPSSTNVSTSNIRMEYEEGANWIPIAHTVSLMANCTQTGALVRVTPTGILPQSRLVRIVFASGLRDVVGDGNLVDIVVGSFQISSSVGQGVDEYREEFSDTVGADLTSQATNPAAPRAEWGDGVLKPNFDFLGTGGPPDGQFDYEVGSTIVGAPTENPILDTTFTLITDTTGSRQEAVVNGVIDVRNFTINEGSSLTVLGPNTLKIYASGNVRISGLLLLRGANNHGVSTLGTACQPEAGATGQVGGGKGGTASYLTTQSTPKGEDGYGPFNQPGLGGGGGHTAYRAGASEPLYIGQSRRPGGGGGGKLGADVMETSRPTCPDQSFVGLDAEAGFPGTPGANDAILGSGVKPVGGTKGPSPFGDSDPNNDFYGVKVMNILSSQPGVVVHGELSQPWAGAGGGAGGDTCTTNNFPTTPFTCQGDEKGCGGGGGGGSLLLMSLGDITIGAKGRIDAGGGCGGGGENSASGVGIQRIGGGSGGGSGGHIILESASQINLSACTVANGAGIFARGGQGGAGKDDAGGAHAPGTPTSASLDALPPNSYPSSVTTTPCRVTNTTSTGTFTYTFSNTVGNGTATNDGDPLNVVTCAGGDGGPGIIQLHVQSLVTDLLLPANTTTNPLRTIVSPTPVGALPTNLQTPTAWDQMLPAFGRFSTGLSNWIPLGSASVTVGSATPHAVQFLFGGTNPATGYVISAGGQVTQLPQILVGALANEPTLPFVTADQRTIVFDPTGLDPIYTQNPNLMLRFGVLLTQGATTSQFEVVAASYSAGQLRLSVATSGTPLPSAPAGYTVAVVPRFFRVITNNVKDALPASSTIQVRFQAAPADAAGNPLVTSATAFLSDATAIQNDPNAANFKFVRFRVDFDILADGSALTFTTPRPTVDFLRLPFKF